MDVKTRLLMMPFSIAGFVTIKLLLVHDLDYK